MAMTDQEQKALRSYCAFLLKEYGFQFSPEDPVIPALYIIHREMQLNNRNNQIIGAAIKEAASKMNSKSFHFNSLGEAWKFQLGIALKWFLGGAILIAVIVIVIWGWSISDEVEQARQIIEKQNRVNILLQRIKIDADHYYFIDFTERKGNSIRNFLEYERLNQKAIRVYLGKE